MSGLPAGRADRDRREVASAEGGREVGERRGLAAVVERDGSTVYERRLDRERALPGGDVGRRKVEARVEQGAQGDEQIGLSRPRLADERTDRAGTKRQPACAAEVDDANLGEQWTGRCAGGGARRRAGLGLVRTRRRQGRVIAPSLAVETSAAYFASTPLS